MSTQQEKPKQTSQFAQQSGGKRSSFISEYLYLLKQNKKWWMLPLLVILLGFGLLMVLSSTGAAPFIYTLF
jgi:hypothetical protein